MALIKCPDCGKMISDKATMCIGCGRPMKEEVSLREILDDKPNTIDIYEKFKFKPLFPTFY